jgi:hypothetical protein
LRRARGVDDGEVAREQGPVLAAQREVALVAAHHLDRHLVRQIEELGLERAAEDVRLFDQRRVLADEERVLDERAAGVLRGRLEAVQHRAPALLGIDEHVRVAEHVGVALGPIERDGARREEAMAEGRAPGLLAREADRHDGVAVDGEQPMDRAAERDLARAPAHRLREGDAAAELREQIGQHLGGGPPALLAPAGDVGALLRLLDDELIDREPQLPGEALGRLLRRAVGPEGGGLRRAEHHLREIGLARGEIVDDQRQAARRAERADRAVREADEREEIVRDGRHRLERAGDEGRGQLFDADLEDELRHRAASTPADPRSGKPSASRWAR